MQALRPKLELVCDLWTSAPASEQPARGAHPAFDCLEPLQLVVAGESDLNRPRAGALDGAEHRWFV